MLIPATIDAPLLSVNSFVPRLRDPRKSFQPGEFSFVNLWCSRWIEWKMSCKEGRKSDTDKSSLERFWRINACRRERWIQRYRNSILPVCIAKFCKKFGLYSKKCLEIINSLWHEWLLHKVRSRRMLRVEEIKTNSYSRLKNSFNRI